MVKGKGRQKIEMKKMEKASNLQVTFSKRRLGLFKKASELSTLCGAEILVLVGSPGGKFYSFGHPSVEDLTERFFNLGHDSVTLRQQNNNQQRVESRPDRSVQDLNGRLTQVHANGKEEKDRNTTLAKMIEDRKQKGSWYEKDLKELDQNELENLKCTLQDMTKKWVSEMSQYYSQVNVYQNYLGESSCGIGGRTADVGTDLFDQRRYTFNNNPNMNFPNNTPLFGYNIDHAPMFGYNNDHTPMFGYNTNHTPMFGYNTNHTPMFGYNNDHTTLSVYNDGVLVPSYNNDGVNVPRANNDGGNVPSYNNDGVNVPRPNNEGAMAPRSNMNDM